MRASLRHLIGFPGSQQNGGLIPRRHDMTERKVALVTGSATGVGAATALGLARKGYDLVINYSRSEAEARAAEAACREAGADVLLFRADVSDDASCRAMV